MVGSSITMSSSGAGVGKVFSSTQSLLDADARAPLKIASETFVDSFPTLAKKTELSLEANLGCRCSHQPSNKYLCNVG